MPAAVPQGACPLTQSRRGSEHRTNRVMPLRARAQPTLRGWPRGVVRSWQVLGKTLGVIRQCTRWCDRQRTGVVGWRAQGLRVELQEFLGVVRGKPTRHPIGILTLSVSATDFSGYVKSGLDRLKIYA